MKTLYLECKMGAAGDMLMGALYELLEDKQGFLEKMNHLGIPSVKISAADDKKCGITGTKIHVHIHNTEEAEHMHDISHTHDHGHSNHEHEQEHHHTHDHSHTSYNDILHLIRHLDLPEEVKENAGYVYRLIGEAESKVHQSTLDQIHFHEVGTMDALADVVGCCYLIHLLGVDHIIASPVCVGNGHVHCAHGILPVPAPATAEILAGIPCYNGHFDGELCTPTGAALLRYFASSFGDMPTMITEKIGYGLGTKDFEMANCIRAFLGETAGQEYKDEIAEISCNLDDMTPEAIGAVMDAMLDAGALDVFTTPIGMKKNRPAVMLTCLCTPEMQDTFELMMLTHTATRGVRTKMCTRKTLTCAYETVQTPYGDIRIKISTGYGIKKCKPEYDDVVSAAKKHGVPFQTVYAAASINC